MLRLLITLALLGFFAVDLVGIGAMPVLLVQKKPYIRSFSFLSGSFLALVVMGILFAKGFGLLVLHFENSHDWLVPGVELLASGILIAVAAVMFWRLRTGQVAVEPSAAMMKYLQLGDWQLFMLGVVIVTVQSLADVVFVIAMIRAGQLELSNLALMVAVLTYAIAALAMQLGIIIAYRMTPDDQRTQTVAKVHGLLANYANQAVIAVSFILGCGLLVNSLLTLVGAPHL